jgi:hypothetical protein
MVSVLASIAVNCGSSPDRVKQKTIKLVFVASPLSTNLSLLNPIVKVLKEKFDDAKEISQKPSIEGKTIQWPILTNCIYL